MVNRDFCILFILSILSRHSFDHAKKGLTGMPRIAEEGHRIQPVLSILSLFRGSANVMRDD